MNTITAQASINPAAEVAANVENTNAAVEAPQDGTPPRVHRIQAARDSRP